MCLAQGPQRSDAGEARTRGLSVSNTQWYSMDLDQRVFHPLLFNLMSILLQI